MLKTLHIALEKKGVIVIERVEIILQHFLGHRIVEVSGGVMALFQKF